MSSGLCEFVTRITGFGVQPDQQLAGQRDPHGSLVKCFTPEECANFLRHNGYFQSP